MNDLVSIITPMYNAEAYLAATLKSIQGQTYDHWELLLVDDNSSDNSKKMARSFANKDKRIHLLGNSQNIGAGMSRNVALGEARGRYIAFLDADDIWHPEKLAKQVHYMQKNNYSFTFTGYEFADKDGKPTGKVVHVPRTITRDSMLKNPIAWTSTIVIDSHAVAKDHIIMPDLRRGQDFVAWLAVLEVTTYAYGLNESLAYYRRTKTSLSANKFKAMQRTWHIYRHVLGMNKAVATKYLAHWAANAVRKRV